MDCVRDRLQSSQLDFDQSRISVEGQALSNMYCTVCKGSPGARESVGAQVRVEEVEASGIEPEVSGTEPTVREGSAGILDVSAGAASEAV
jgi:hypothetical protein